MKPIAYKYARDPLYGCLNYPLFMRYLLGLVDGQPIKSKLHLKYMLFLCLKYEGIEGITPDDF